MVIVIQLSFIVFFVYLITTICENRVNCYSCMKKNIRNNTPKNVYNTIVHSILQANNLSMKSQMMFMF